VPDRQAHASPRYPRPELIVRRIPVVALLALAACLEPAGPSHRGPAFVVEGAVFQLDTVGEMVKVSIPYRVYNQSGHRLYISRCLLTYGALLERESAGGWVSAWSPAYGCAQTAPFQLGANDSLMGTMDVFGTLWPNAGPRFDIPTDTVWDYRLRIPMFAQSHGMNPPTGALPANSQTVSTIFRIVP
jgi:hypothetical protein